MKETVVLRETRCAECGAVICSTTFTEWVYTSHRKGKRNYFCTYKCKNAFDERIRNAVEEEKRKNRKDSTLAKVFYYLADHDGWIDYDEIQEQLGIEEKQTQKCIKQLKALAYVDYKNGSLPNKVEIWEKEYYVK